MVDIELLKKICLTPGAPGFEQPIRALLMQEMEGYADDVQIDPMGNLIVFIKGISSSKLMLTAHMDEISFIVQHIDDDGFIRFLPLGGFDAKTLTAQRVKIHGKKEVIGVMGSKPIHLMNPDERNKAAQIKDYFIDTGLPKAELEKYISIGNPITRERELIQMGKCINSKSLDNRISVYVLLEIIKAFGKAKPELDLYAVFTVQEEVGLRGAKSAAHRIAPDYAINIDTTIAFDVPGAQAHEMITKLGNGVAIKFYDSSVIPDYRMVNFLKECADMEKIKWQAELLSGGGTDTGAVQTSGNGSIAGAISIPTRHIHQVIEMVHEEDVLSAIQLLNISIKQITKFNFEFK
ncbi:MAG: M42 family metallopeptidase [Saprospiraceae bacterium]|nr:M42 family metallopeptidase [Saprospiraceae bacterium]MBK8450376.1 M42 family metallopeptidase [Saprospiraceae bacterium]MBK8485543.1 M42 family metallopeptidase [Saprospiraceae bacterium]MBK9222772.1 M42 family metallopeptidase [Saprospiraceae bacterium]MBK9720188.1 M42 family metallopeptidase [Saprospiraceae bacterium]